MINIIFKYYPKNNESGCVNHSNNFLSRKSKFFVSLSLVFLNDNLYKTHKNNAFICEYAHSMH